MVLSFIIPVFNCEKYISNCIYSILNSSLSDYEIILINDGSQDKSLNICNEFAAKNKAIFVINQENKGASSARNAGLNAARGDYIWFVDADDSIYTDHVYYLYESIKENYDVINFRYNKIESTGTTNCCEFPVKAKMHNGIDLVTNSRALYLWDKIYKRSLIGSIRFAEGTKNIEDLYFNVCVLPKAVNILYLDKVLYNYICLSTTSTSRNRSKRNLIKLSQDTLYFQQKLIDDINNFEGIHKAMLKQILNSTLIGHIFSLMNFYNYHRLKNTIRKYKNWGVYPIRKTNNKKANLFLLFINHSMTLILMYILISIKKRILLCGYIL